MERNNYLGNLPKKNNNLKKISNEKYINYIIDGLLKAEYNTENQTLKNFKDTFAGLMIRKIYHGYNPDKYFDIKNVLCHISEDLIINLYDELIVLLNKQDSENISVMEDLTKIYNFPFLTDRVKNENGYEPKTRNINIADIYQGIITVSRSMEGFISLYIKGVVASNMNLKELKILRDMLIESDTMAYYVKYDKQFGMFKDCGVPIYEKLYTFYYKELRHKLIDRVNKEINKYGLIEQKYKDKEYTDYISGYKLRSEKEKRNNWFRH